MDISKWYNKAKNNIESNPWNTFIIFSSTSFLSGIILYFFIPPIFDCEGLSGKTFIGILKVLLQGIFFLSIAIAGFKLCDKLGIESPGEHGHTANLIMIPLWFCGAFGVLYLLAFPIILIKYLVLQVL